MVHWDGLEVFILGLEVSIFSFQKRVPEFLAGGGWCAV
jgi:hypothetical protein